METARIVNVPDISAGDAFVDLPPFRGYPVEWIGHSGLPRNFLEKISRRPRISRYRAAWQAVGDARRATAIISHLPRMTRTVEELARLRGKRAPHLAFSFNFTDIPVGRERQRFARALDGVERFGVYSAYEAALYPRIFSLPAERFRHVMWAQSAPPIDQSAPAPDKPFVIAVGGEGRDYQSIVTAARARPDITWLVIARPTTAFENAPANVTTMYNLPAPLTWGLAKRAAAVVVPLRSAETCCGHITIASAQLLGLPVITTRSRATDEYVVGIESSILVEAGDPDALAEAASSAIDDRGSLRDKAERALPQVEARYDRARWAGLIMQFLHDFGR